MTSSKKGCVYFFRHVGLTPVKIGFSLNESPVQRFNQFKTFAPYGSEILGFIQTDEPRNIEEKIHLKYRNKKLSGEWFEISEDDVQKEVQFYSNAEDIKERNDFYISWANRLFKRNHGDELKQELSKKDSKRIFFEEYSSDRNINKMGMARKFGVTRQTIHIWIKEFELKL